MDYYNCISKSYNRLHKAEQIRKIDVIISELKLAKKTSVLDVGCGTGIFGERADCFYVGIDPSMDMISRSGKGFFVQGFAESLPFKDNSFDFVVSVTAVHNFNDIEAGISEIKRVSRNSACLSVLKRSSKFIRIEEVIRSNFSIIKCVDEGPDRIFFLKK